MANDIATTIVEMAEKMKIADDKANEEEFWSNIDENYVKMTVWYLWDKRRRAFDAEWDYTDGKVKIGFFKFKNDNDKTYYITPNPEDKHRLKINEAFIELLISQHSSIADNFSAFQRSQSGNIGRSTLRVCFDYHNNLNEINYANEYDIKLCNCPHCGHTFRTYDKIIHEQFTEINPHIFDA